MAKVKLYTYTVTGHGEFPIDMLRYDRCWPKGETDDSYAIGRSHRFYSSNEIGVRVVGLNPPTTGRWHSFGWKVVEVTESILPT